MQFGLSSGGIGLNFALQTVKPLTSNRTGYFLRPRYVFILSMCGLGIYGVNHVDLRDFPVYTHRKKSVSVVKRRSVWAARWPNNLRKSVEGSMRMRMTRDRKEEKTFTHWLLPSSGQTGVNKDGDDDRKILKKLLSACNQHLSIVKSNQVKSAASDKKTLHVA